MSKSILNKTLCITKPASLRLLATASNPQLAVFDRASKQKQRTRSALNVDQSRRAEYLRDEVAVRTIERLGFITRDFTNVLDLGCNAGNFAKKLTEKSEVPPGGDEADVHLTNQLNKDRETISNKILKLVMVDSSEEMLYRDKDLEFNKRFPGELVRIVADEETMDHPVFEPNSFDAVISNLSLHWINDLPQVLKNINTVLKPDGLFMGTLFGGDTLYELRTSLQLAELERRGGISPRVSPLVHLNDIGSLLNRAGFSMLTIDTEDIVMGGFPDIVTMCDDLRLMGEQNSLLSRASYLPRDVLLAANEICKSLHGEKGEDGQVTLPATFNVINMIGWKKSESQPQPLARGSGQVNLKDIL